MHDTIELNTYKQIIRLSLSRFVYGPVSIDDSIGISIDTLIEPSTDYPIEISIDVIYHGFDPLLPMVYKCFNYYLLYYRVYLVYL